MTIEERVAALEVENKSVFHQIDEMKTELADNRSLIRSIEAIAVRTEAIEKQTAGIDHRLQTIELAPAESARHIRQTIISSVVSVLVGAVLGGLLALIIK